MNISQKLKQCRSAKNLTQAEVADQLHVSRKTVSGWENGRSYPDPTSLIQLSDLYHVPIDDLLRDECLLEQYDKAKKNDNKLKLIVRVEYIINIFCFIFGYIELFHVRGVHTFIIPTISIFNLIMLLFHFQNWQKFRRSLMKLAGIATFLVLFAINVTMTIFDQQFVSYFTRLEPSYVAGLAVGRIILLFILSLSGSVILLMWPFQRVFES